jgi:hypothetical protein
MASYCAHCSKELPDYSHQKISRSDECPHCHADLKSCLNCKFYEKNSHWECREDIPEQVQDKTRANYCEYFSLSSTLKNSSSTKTKEDLMSAAEALFKKK